MIFGSQVPSFSSGQSAPGLRPYTTVPGVKAVFLGDSITHGSNAAAGRRWVDQLPCILGTAVISANSLERGVPGQTTAQMLARYATDVRANGAQVLFALGGTNDAGQGVPLSQFAANIKGIAAETRKDGIPLIVGTVPPRGASSITTQIRTLTAQYNAWLQAWAPGAGVKLSDVFINLSQSTSDQMASGYDSGDGVHPETTGHQKIAEAMADAFAPLGTANHLVQSPNAFNMITNPLFLGNSSTGWYEQPGGTGTAPAYSFAADTTGKLKYGQWRVMDFDATASGGTRYYLTSVPVVAGSTVLITSRLDLEDVAGGFYAAANSANPTAVFQLRLFNADTFASLAILAPNAVRVPGPVSRLYTVPAGVTHLGVTIQAQLPTGQHARFKFGELGCFDVTSLPDLANLI
jgi:lysophospholipase L1-like esterase